MDLPGYLLVVLVELMNYCLVWLFDLDSFSLGASEESNFSFL
jgi:hypothetical protein